MDKSILKRLAEQMTADGWPLVRDQYISEQARNKTLEQRVAELEGASLLQAIGFLRLEKLVGGLATFAERVKSAMWGKL